MKVLIIYDSMYGNTEKIAKAIGGAITGEVKVVRVGEANPSEMEPIDLLIVGSPTHGGRATPAVQDFLNKFQKSALKGINVAAFDTRFSGIKGFLVGIFGYAAGRIADSLNRKGGILVVSPEGFLVTSTKGPLEEGELERAADWAKGIVESKK